MTARGRATVRGAAGALHASHARWTARLLPAVDVVAMVSAVLVARLPWTYGAAYVVVSVGALGICGHHRVRICLRLGDEAPRLVAVTLVSVLPLALLGVPLLPVAPVAAGMVLTGRACVYHLLRSARRRRLREPAVIVGSDQIGVRVAQLLHAHPELGLSPHGFVDDTVQASGDVASVLGAVASLPTIVAQFDVRRIVVCFPDTPDAVLVRALRDLPSDVNADVCVVPRMSAMGMRLSPASLDEIWGIPLIPLRRIGRPSRVAKRSFDVTIGTLLLATLAPLLLGLLLAVRLRARVPALFRQERITTPGTVAAVLKLRTIAEHRDSDTRWTVETSRYLPNGAFLRATHLDELPQLVNVLRGDMSLVGARPERPFFAEMFAESIPEYRDRLRMPAGITGWAQIHGLHGDTSIEERARFDNQYIEYWSVWRDLVILARTVINVSSCRMGLSR